MGVTIDGNGRVRKIGSAPDDAVIRPLPGRALLPGFINSHSHAFQRALRGRTEGSSGRRHSFWSWRDDMYRLVMSMTPDDVEAITLQCYREMRAAGYTTVKEFHYVHHRPDGGQYDNVHELSLRIASAARRAGIQLHLLRVAYPAAVESAQRRFADRSVQLAIQRTEDLRSRLDCKVGIAPHSVRAVSPEGFHECAAWASMAGAECHAHLAEQPREVAWSVERYGCRPVELVRESLGPGFVGVHLTHLTQDEVELVGASRATACICPTTEANLGDGVPRTSDLLAAGVCLAIGSDSQAELDPFAELRLMEYNERNRLGRRRVLDPSALLSASTEALQIGVDARLLAIDLDHPSIVGADANHLSGALVMGGRADCVVEVFTPESPEPSQDGPQRWRALLKDLDGRA